MLIMNRLLGNVVAIFIFFAAFTSVLSVAHGKPTAPVSIEYTVPDHLQAGDTVSTTIKFVAQADLRQLDVSVAPYEGIDVVSQNEKILFENVKLGEYREIDVTVRLTSEIGYLSVFAMTTTERGTSTKAIAIRYGTAGDATKQKLKSQESDKTHEGEKLILVPGEKRP